MNYKTPCICIVLVSIFSIQPSYTQDIGQAEHTLRSVADNILSNTGFTFKSPKGEIISDLTPKVFSNDVKITSPYNEWKYWNGVLNIAMVELGKTFNEKKYTDFSIKNYQFAFDNYKIFQKNNPENLRNYKFTFYRLYNPQELDDCGAEAGGLIEVYAYDPQKKYLDYLERTAHHILYKQERLDDGTLVRKFPHEMTLWADDLYMSVVFLSRMGHLTGEAKYFDDAIKQVENFNKYLWDPFLQLYYHCWYGDTKTNGVAHWGRCNGWVMLAIGDLLDNLPEDHSKRPKIIELFKQHLLGLSRYQSPNGLWHQILDRPDSYPETSASAMFVYSVARAVNKGWIEDRYISIATEGWKGIQSKIREDGQVEDICIGTGIKDDLIFYYKRPTKLNDIHGLGAVLLAGTEIIKYQRTKE